MRRILVLALAVAAAALPLTACATRVHCTASADQCWLVSPRGDADPVTPSSSPAPARRTTITTYVPAPTTTYVQYGESADASAEASLQAQRAYDRPSVEQLTGSWVPQLSSKTYGTVDNGIAYSYPAIWQDYQQLRARYPSALLLWSGDYSTFTSGNYWVTVAGLPATAATSANSWCDANGIGKDDCYAKLISHSAGPKGATVHR